MNVPPSVDISKSIDHEPAQTPGEFKGDAWLGDPSAVGDSSGGVRSRKEGIYLEIGENEETARFTAQTGKSEANCESEICENGAFALMD